MALSMQQSIEGQRGREGGVEGGKGGRGGSMCIALVINP